ncbi:restriction endonuclease subunit S [Thiomicrorhabdus sp.]|uniref:restriction endonuclease subunit S n=1 Tax=Thiomicrorhabdus sp. TaxID=2039724 RepID=UPI0029C8FFB2|nr:restriction endonuclease subunit S [Thiomicrorhabdus sp.]
MRRVQLSEVCDISSGGTPSRKNAEFFNGEIPWAKISDIEHADNGVIYDTEEHISSAGLKNIRGKLFPKGTLLFAMYGSIGKVAICGRELSTNQAILGIRPKGENEIDLGYLKNWFASNKQKLINQGRGVALKNLSATIIRNLEIELPPFNDQIRIAHLLGKVEGLIAQRKQHLQQLDDLLKSVFLEMFGDPVRNEKGWDIVSLSSYGSFKNGLNFGKGESGKSVRYLGVGDFKAKARLDDIDGLTFIELNELPSEEYFLKDDDLLFVRSNGNRELVGRCMAVYPADKKVTYSGFIIRYRIDNPDLKSTYLVHLFRSIAFRRVIFQGGQGANIQNINQKILSGLPVPLPPKEFQNQFASIVDKVEALKSRYQRSLADLQSLYSALSQKAFKGELDLSQVPLREPEQPADEVAMAIPEPEVADKTVAIHLPETQNLLNALSDRSYVEPLLIEWLESYHSQLNGQKFSFDEFISAAQVRISELHPDGQFELFLEDYEHIKQWVFEALKTGRLQQAQNVTGQDKNGKPIFGNQIELQAGVKP